MSKIELEGILTIAYSNSIVIIGDYEMMECHFCKEYVEGIINENDFPHSKDCLHVRMQKHVESLGYTREDYEELFCENK